MRDRRKPNSLRRLPESFHKELEEMSFRNVVLFYKLELLNLVNGSPAYTQFSSGVSRKLVKKGIIEKQVRGGLGTTSKPTPRARAILEGSD